MLDASTEPGGINFCSMEIAKKITWTRFQMFGVPIWPLAYTRGGLLSLTAGTNPVLAMPRTAVGSAAALSYLRFPACREALLLQH